MRADKVPSVGLLGVATFLPPEVRSNDWWPAATVARWRAARPPLPPLPADATPAMQRVMAALAAQDADPFHGVTTRHVLPAEMTALDMERAAAEQAIARAGVDRATIDLVLTHSPVPEVLLSNPGPPLHRALGLAPACLAVQLDASSYSFLAQLALAEQLVAAGRARHVLLAQSALSSRLLDRDDPVSPLLGDGAAAAVVGPTPGAGVRAAVHRTDGRFPRTLIASTRGGRWYDRGDLVLHSGDPRGAFQVFLETADLAAEVVGAALAEAGARPQDVRLFGVHQGTPWLRQVTQEATGLAGARTVDTLAATGYLFGASIPLVLETAQRRGLVARGDLVVLHGGGVGATYGAIALDWGDPIA